MLTCSPTWAEEIDPGRLDQCRRTEDRLDRLACFDALASGKPGQVPVSAATVGVWADAKPPAPTYRTMSLTDLQVDGADLKGRRVEVQGVLQQLGEMVLLKDELLSMNGVFVEIAAVPREDRRRILQLCSTGCTAIVRGRVADVMMSAGIKAERIEVP